MPKVTFSDTTVLVDGLAVAAMEGTREVYVHMKDDDGKYVVVARFKYAQPKANAKHWLKHMLSRMSSVEIIEALKPGKMETPLGLAEKSGFVSLNMQKALKLKAEAEARNQPVKLNRV
jgi:hypothetical protein